MTKKKKCNSVFSSKKYLCVDSYYQYKQCHNHCLASLEKEYQNLFPIKW